MPDPKQILVNDLWLPLVKDGGDQLFPRRRIHKNMKLFTLTDMNYEEIKIFEENKLTKRENIIAWNHSYQQTLRLETELGRSVILSEGRLDDALNEDNQTMPENFACDILNLDFTSQKPINGAAGRIENEINCGNILISILNNNQMNGFVLIYTTLLDQFDLNPNNIEFTLNTPNAISNPVSNINDKVELIKIAINTLCQNNSYLISNTSDLLSDTNNQAVKLYSMGIVSARSN